MCIKCMKNTDFERGFGVMAIIIAVVATLAVVGGGISIVNTVQENKEQEATEEFAEHEIADREVGNDEDRTPTQTTSPVPQSGTDSPVPATSPSYSITQDVSEDEDPVVPAEIFFPKGKKAYSLDDTVRMAWTPISPGVETIELMSGSSGWKTYYAEKVHGDPINTEGYWDLDLTNWSLDPGVYDIRISSPSFGSDFVDVEYGAFEIISDPPEITAPSDEEVYTPGDTIRIQWSPDDPGIEKIEVRGPDGIWAVVYAEKVFGYPINTKGFFDYILSNYAESGSYDIRISSPSYGSDFEDTEFDAFEVVSEPPEITAPTDGNVYDAHDTIRIRWDPNGPGVETIEIRGPSGGWATYYAEKVHGDPINTKGYWDLDLENWFIVEPGFYDIRISSPSFGSNFVDVEYNAFEVK